MQKPLNPFMVEGYLSSKYFCDRVEETENMITALRSERNVALISPRRMGKSGLIHHVFAKVRERHPEIKTFYIDLLHTQTLSNLIEEFSNAVFGELDTPVTKIYNKIVKVFRHCTPVISHDAMTGAPTLSFNIMPGQEKHTLKEIFDYLKTSGKRIYVAFDEFQQISEYPEPGVEALLRSFIQFAHNISFIFAGSKKHMMHAMFYMPSRPFYQSTQTMPLYPIPEDKYYEFCSRFFSQSGKNLLPEAFAHVYKSVMGHTWYIQYWMSKVYDNAPETIDVVAVETALSGILREEDDNFFTYMQLLTIAQRKVVTGIAKAGELKSPISSALTTSLGMGAPSTVHSCIKVLVEKEILLEERDTYTVYNRFFMLWLARR